MSVQQDKFTQIADAIREKLGTNDLIKPNNFAQKIASIKTAPDTMDATATSGDILIGKTAYVKDSKVTGTMADNGSINLEINGLTVNEVTVPEGYSSGGTIILTSDIEEALAQI